MDFSWRRYKLAGTYADGSCQFGYLELVFLRLEQGLECRVFYQLRVYVKLDFLASLPVLLILNQLLKVLIRNGFQNRIIHDRIVLIYADFRVVFDDVLV